ncbi:Panacea domain-containing protein [Virgibacillus pantothenticus]|uniref:Antitoxin SocA-like Panacea domain-containing protein n=1 Tax=Virgibacillus pantothenticus TaxID=1473 RepID=A0A0L0QK94_VIRPA|nr:type II toxin-antitoxin system antitoxin SocA domain-containing protein [Virgibacillus pantothenticus]KNE19025.1 hypothetical protein AFK71_10685 [Virgibacillus pantothenticus]MED3737233.1 DUF4065 domain-containing protein [Virgibacillus pantothenticus]QTY15462.1 DUF4065 domain-containing protein [Virgibacillus pantothenticus]SIS80991.1 Uncharacterized phage-associated protein [Virgibacillus pantothenticus]
MGEVKAIDVAKWFMKHKLDSPRNTFDGNMKLQKLLYFSQLIHYANHNKILFSEEMKAYENGTVINDVRLTYRNELDQLVDQAEDFEGFNSPEVDYTLNLTSEIFGGMNAKELSDLNHEFVSWKVPFKESQTDQPGRYIREKNVINPLDGLFLEDVRNVKQMLEAYCENEDDMNYEVVNGVTFYYNSSEIHLDEKILAKLGELKCSDEVYTVTMDKEQGLIIS